MVWYCHECIFRKGTLFGPTWYLVLNSEEQRPTIQTPTNEDGDIVILTSKAAANQAKTVRECEVTRTHQN